MSARDFRLQIESGYTLTGNSYALSRKFGFIVFQ